MKKIRFLMAFVLAALSLTACSRQPVSGPGASSPSSAAELPGAASEQPSSPQPSDTSPVSYTHLIVDQLAALDQAESQSRSENIKFGIRHRIRSVKTILNHTQFLGYTKDMCIRDMYKQRQKEDLSQREAGLTM